MSIRKSVKRGHCTRAEQECCIKSFADLQGPICYKDAQNKEISLIVYKI